MKKFIPVNKPLITNADAKEVYNSLKTGWISSEGPNVKKFEQSFSNFIGKKYSAAVSSGSAALEIAVKSLGLKSNDEIIVPNFTIISNALPVIKLGYKIKLIDCEIYNWNMSFDKLKKSISNKTKAIIITHIYNFPFRIDLLKQFCEKKKIFLIEDAAENLGQSIHNNKCGSFGDISVFSFYANKQITTGEGGMLCTNNKKIYNKIISLRNLCFGKVNRFNHSDIGWNYRMTNMQATIGLNQLKRINSIVLRRQKIGKFYYKKLSKNKNIFIPSAKNSYSKNIYWVNAVLIINKKINLDSKKTIKILNHHGIEARPFFWPMHKQNILKKKYIIKKMSFLALNIFLNMDFIYLLVCR